MKLNFYNKFKKRNISTYTVELMKYLARRAGHQITEDLQDADLVCLSICHHSEITDLIKLRKATDKPILVGGHATYSPNPFLIYADFVNLGHGFEIWESFKTIDDLKTLPYIYHNNKMEGVYSQKIDWDSVPAIQIGKNTYSYLWSVGCRNKCNFCNTSWTNTYQTNHNKLRLDILRQKTIGKQLYIITNDYSKSDVKRAVSDVLIPEYNKDPLVFQNITLLRSGIEAATEDVRRFLGKNLKDEQITTFFHLTNIYKKTTNIFMIVGLETEDEIIDFADRVIGKGINRQPLIGFIMNYLNPNVGTPLEDFDCTKIIPLDFKRIVFYFHRINARFRVYHSNAIKPYNKIYITLIERSSQRWQVENILKMQKNSYKFDEMDRFIDDLNTFKLLDLARGDYDKPQVDFPYQKKLTSRKRWIDRNVINTYKKNNRGNVNVKAS